MTTVYGVTFIGAREQIEKQLKDKGDLAAEDCWTGASYLAKVVSLTITLLSLCNVDQSLVGVGMYRRLVHWCEAHPGVAHHLCQAYFEVDPS
jgi:DNA-directed RNA polymerase